jgi:hypothetical protein
VIKAWSVRGIKKRRFFKFITERIAQARLMVAEILCVECDQSWPSSVARGADRRGETRRCILRYSVEKDDPQPQVDLALGFLIVNPPPVIVSTKSTSAFFKY